MKTCLEWLVILLIIFFGLNIIFCDVYVNYIEIEKEMEGKQDTIELSQNIINDLNNRNAQLLQQVSILGSKVEVELPHEELFLIAKTVWGEIKGGSDSEKRLVIWTIFNRVEHSKFPNNITEVVLQENQFAGYLDENPIDDTILVLVYEEYQKWVRNEEAPIVLPYASTNDYLCFHGDGKNNWFRNYFKIEGDLDV